MGRSLPRQTLVGIHQRHSARKLVPDASFSERQDFGDITLTFKEVMLGASMQRDGALRTLAHARGRP